MEEGEITDSDYGDDDDYKCAVEYEDKDNSFQSEVENHEDKDSSFQSEIGQEDKDSRFQSEFKLSVEEDGNTSKDLVNVDAELIKLFDGASEEEEEDGEIIDDGVEEENDVKVLKPICGDFCQICKTEKPKYRCPACEFRSCSLKCCQKHKVLTSCEGVAPKSRLIPLNKYDSLTMLNDYRFLEEALRVRENCKKVNVLPRNNKFSFQMWRILVKECYRRRIKLCKMPVGFEKNASNLSCFEKFADTIFWNINFVFADANDICVKMHRIPETVSLATLLKQILHPKLFSDYVEISKQLTCFSEKDITEIKVLMKVEQNRWTNDQRYYELNVNQSVKENLKFKTVIEYPTFLVCLPNSGRSYSLLTEDMKYAAKDDNDLQDKRENSESAQIVDVSGKNKRKNKYRKSRRQKRHKENEKNEQCKMKNNNNDSVTAKDKVNLEVKIVHVESDSTNQEEIVQPLKRMIRLTKSHQFQRKPFVSQRPNLVDMRRTFQQEKFDAIKQISDGLQKKVIKTCVDAFTDCSTKVNNNDFVDGKNAAISAKSVVTDDYKEAKPKNIEEPAKKVVKTAFFGILGDDEYIDLSSSDSD